MEREDEITLGTTVVLCSPGREKGEDDSFPLPLNLLSGLWSLLETIAMLFGPFFQSIALTADNATKISRLTSNKLFFYARKILKSENLPSQ